MSNFQDRIHRICLFFSTCKAHARGTFPKCRAGLGYCLILRTLCLVLGPLIWERPLPPRSFSPYSCSTILFMLRSPSVSSPIFAPSPSSFLSINTGRTCVAEDPNMEVATKSMCSYTSLASSSKGGLSFCSLKSNSSLLCGGGRCCDLWASTRHCMPVLRCQDLGNTALPWNADVSGHTFLPLSRFSLC
jgi:hypothetical protein